MFHHCLFCYSFRILTRTDSRVVNREENEGEGTKKKRKRIAFPFILVLVFGLFPTHDHICLVSAVFFHAFSYEIIRIADHFAQFGSLIPPLDGNWEERGGSKRRRESDMDG